MRTLKKLLIPLLIATLFPGIITAQRVSEYLNRGIVAVKKDSKTTFVSWRMLLDDPQNISFNVYRALNGKTEKLNAEPITSVTFFVDSTANPNETYSYTVKSVLNGKEAETDGIARVAGKTANYLAIPISPPPGGDVYGSKYTYSANDASVADLDGDGEYEIILKWDPSNAKNPPQKGFTGNQIIDAYKLNGKRLWRIDLGINIRSGAAYTQFLVFDFDGDGKAEMACKTADGSVDGTGQIIGDKSKDWRTKDEKDPKYGKIADGPEYLTVFDGLTGAALATTDYIPTRYPLDGWGGIGGNGGNDNTASRSDRFTACVAYLDGNLPSIVMVRGWYGRSVLAAYDFRKGKLSKRWVFDSAMPEWKNYSGMGNHSLSVADVDNDGKDEVCIGAMTVDDNGKGLYTTGLRHGDALHLADLDPDRPGLEVFGVHESEERTVALQTPGVAAFDARTGEILFGQSPGVDVGRGVAADIDPRHRGFENWGGPGGLRDVHGKTISQKTPPSTNFAIWWDGDLLRELLDKNYIDKWDWEKEEAVRLLTAEGCVSNNGTKATPCLTADILGDWREEVLWRSDDNKELRIYTSTIPTSYRFVSLMQDSQYRLSVAWQNVSYNQPPHTSFYLGEGMKTPVRPALKVNKKGK
ncbi:rhamnogalacturonan lyase [Pedobacter sp. SYSU D00535]|uniref:rhamnogalacturonan lyase n=1 Tax=Pedobacter sp. SYSU D00535 TaxID=2810308 RepID=UPI001F61C3A8|nr:rhamnogalacturonan lyase [Pedobacter sp. SYSU D00535]